MPKKQTRFLTTNHYASPPPANSNYNYPKTPVKSSPSKKTTIAIVAWITLGQSDKPYSE